MKVQEVILRAVAKKITWAQAGEVIELCERQMRRWKERYQEFGYDGLFDRRLGKPSPKRVPLATVEEILRLYQEQYADFNVRHFHEKLREKHAVTSPALSPTNVRIDHPGRTRSRYAAR